LAKFWQKQKCTVFWDTVCILSCGLRSKSLTNDIATWIISTHPVRFCRHHTTCHHTTCDHKTWQMRRRYVVERLLFQWGGGARCELVLGLWMLLKTKVCRWIFLMWVMDEFDDYYWHGTWLLTLRRDVASSAVHMRRRTRATTVVRLMSSLSNSDCRTDRTAWCHTDDGVVVVVVVVVMMMVSWWWCVRPVNVSLLSPGTAPGRPVSPRVRPVSPRPAHESRVTETVVSRQQQQATSQFSSLHFT